MTDDPGKPFVMENEDGLKQLLEITAKLRSRTVDSDWIVLPGPDYPGQEMLLIVTHLDYASQSIHDVWDVALIMCSIVAEYTKVKLRYEVKATHIVIADEHTLD